MKMPKIPEPKQPDIPREALRGAEEARTRPRGRESLVSSSPASRRKPAYTVKNSLLG